jgi:hypothetical protein
MEEFIEFLKKKKIDPERFRAAEPARFEEFQTLFAQVHPNSFTAQKLYLINQVRRQYHLAAGRDDPPTQLGSDQPPPAAKPAKRPVAIRRKEE